MFCPNCGNQINGNEAFCGKCGHRFAQNTASAAPQPTQQQVQQPRPVQQPQQMQRNIPPQVQQGGGAQPKAEGKGPNPVAVFFITFLILGAITAAVMLFYKPGYLINNDDDDEESSSVSSSQDDDSSESKKSKKKDDSSERGDESSEEEKTTTKATTTTAAETEPPETTTTAEPVQTTAPETTAPEKTTTTAKPGKEPELSTKERPKFDEFEWCFGQDGLIYEMPEGVTEITDLDACTGGWKAMIIYNPTNKAGTFIRELDNFTVITAGDKAEVTVDWYLMDIDSGESYSEEDMEDTVFSGTAEDGYIIVMAGDAAMTLNQFWTDGKSEYATGMIDLGDGTYAYVGLVRP